MFFVRVQNDGLEPERLRVQGTGGSSRFSVTYRVGSQNVSAAVKDGSYRTPVLEANATATLRVVVQALAGAPSGIERRVDITVRSDAVPTIADRVAAITSRPVFCADQRTVAAQINTTRRNQGRPGLTLHRRLADKAQRWAEHMAARNRLSHSVLTQGVPAGWRALAENVGYGGGLSEVHGAFLGSAGHRANILGPYNYVGTGVARGGGRLWVVHVFMRR